MSEKIPAFIEKNKRGNAKKIILVNPEDQFKHERVTVMDKKMPKEKRAEFVRPLMPLIKKMFKNNSKFRRKLIATIPDPRVVAKDAVEVT